MGDWKGERENALVRRRKQIILEGGDVNYLFCENEGTHVKKGGG